MRGLHYDVQKVRRSLLIQLENRTGFYVLHQSHRALSFYYLIINVETFNDLKQALLMKIDAFHYIQLGTVYRYHVCFVASHISLVLDNAARPSCCSVARYKSKHPCLRISYFCVSSTEVFIPSLTRKSSPCTKAAMYLWRT